MPQGPSPRVQQTRYRILLGTTNMKARQEGEDISADSSTSIHLEIWDRERLNLEIAPGNSLPSLCPVSEIYYKV